MKKAMILLVPAVLMFFVAGSFFTGCRKREVLIPTQPEVATATPTVGTPLPTNTATHTYTFTRTNTGTHTHTFTNTHTLQYTATPSWTPTNTLSPTNTLPPTNTNTATNTFTSTNTLPPTSTPTPCGGGSFAASYPFTSSVECWTINNDLGSSTLAWTGTPPVGATGGALQANITFDAAVQSGEIIKVDAAPGQTLTNKRISVRVYVETACKGTSWGGAVQTFIQDTSGWQDYGSWTNIPAYDSWQTYYADVTSTLPVTQLGIKVNTGNGAGVAASGNVYVDSVNITDIPTPTPTVGCTNLLMNGCETIGENGTWSGTNANRAIVTSPSAAITQGTSAMAVTLLTTAWNQEAFNLTSFNTGISNGVTTNTWVGVDQLRMNIYVPAGAFQSWGQLQFVAVSNTDDGNTNGAGADWDSTLDGAGDKGFTLGAMNTITWDLQWATSPIDPTNTINKLVFIVNGDNNTTTPVPIYIDNIQLIDCP